MLNTILGALLPMVVTLLLGFVAGWHHDFRAKDAWILNRMVLLYAVPLALFVGTVGTPRAELRQDAPLIIALCVAIVGLYGVVFLLSRFAFRFRVGTSALAALTASAPAIPFVGPAVLGDLSTDFPFSHFRDSSWSRICIMLGAAILTMADSAKVYLRRIGEAN